MESSIALPESSSMEWLAQAFDQPFDSPEHREFAEDGWIGGELVTVRYWLGRLLNRNLFRETEDTVAALLQQYLATRGYHAAASLSADLQCWGPLAIFLRSDLERACGIPVTGKLRQIAALRAIIGNPGLTNAEVAELAHTTEKQVAQMSDVTYFRRCWMLRQSDPSGK